MSKFLRTSLESEKKQTIATEERIYILLPKPMDHLFHPMGRVSTWPSINFFFALRTLKFGGGFKVT